MPDKRTAIVQAAAIMSVFLLVGIVYPAGQIGEFAGHLNVSVPLGGSNSTYMTIFNNGNSSLNFVVLPPGIKSADKNATLPTMTASPQNGTLEPRANKRIYFTFSMPSNNKVNTTFEAVVIVEQIPNSSQTGGGATLTGGVGKIITVTSAPALVNWTLYAEIAIAAIVIAAIGASYYLLVMKGGLKKMRASSKARKAAADREKLRKLRTQLAAQRARVRTASSKGRKAARKAAKKPAKRKAKRSR